MPRPLMSMTEALARDDVFAPFLAGDSWRNWRCILKAINGEPLDAAELEIFRSLTGDREYAGLPVSELWAVVGRRGGKSRMASVHAAYQAALIDWRDRLVTGERGVVMVLSPTVQQSHVILSFTKGLFAESPALRSLVESEVAEGLRLSSGVDIVIKPASYRTVRGPSYVSVVADELAFWRDETTSNPAEEILNAVRPSLAYNNGMLVAISSPYSMKGELYYAWKRDFGPAGDPKVLVIQAPSKVMNPGLPQAVIDRAMERDPDSAKAEFLAQWRTDVAQFISEDILENAVSRGVKVRPPIPGVRYHAFGDPSGGGSDSFSLCIAHNEKDRIVIDLVTERLPPFSPDAVVAEHAALLKQYGIAKIVTDRYAGIWPKERYAVHGIAHEVASKTRSDLYLSFLPALNAGRIDLLDHPKSLAQFINLERRTRIGGRDTIDHQQGQHDDLANAIAGAVDLLSEAGVKGLAMLVLARQELAKMREQKLIDDKPQPPKIVYAIGSVERTAIDAAAKAEKERAEQERLAQLAQAAAKVAAK
jgi:hypothetical protein